MQESRDDSSKEIRGRSAHEKVRKARGNRDNNYRASDERNDIDGSVHNLDLDAARVDPLSHAFALFVGRVEKDAVAENIGLCRERIGRADDEIRLVCDVDLVREVIEGFRTAFPREFEHSTRLEDAIIRVKRTNREGYWGLDIVCDDRRNTETQSRMSVHDCEQKEK